MTIKEESTKQILADAARIVAGSFVFALGVSVFEAPHGLAAGGLTGLAMIIQGLAAKAGVALPIGLQTLAMNALLMVPVLRAGGVRYAWRTLLGIVASSLFVDLTAALPPLGGDDLLLCALCGGVVTGLGLGLAFTGGGNTGGVDIIAQLAARRTSVSVGNAELACDLAVVAASVPVFSVANALYAVVFMFVSARAVDYAVDGPRAEKAAWVISDEYERIEQGVLVGLDRGCTRLSARGSYSGAERPMLFVVLNRRQVPRLKAIVSEADSRAILAITDVHEVFGEGFHDIDAEV